MLELSDRNEVPGPASGLAPLRGDPGPLLAVDRVSKRYEIYERPQDRLKQSLVPRLQTLLPVGLRRSQPFFNEFWALRDISLNVDRGEALGILGRNGAGKSTLLQIIAGTLAPTSGNVIVHGKTAALLELGSGFSPDFTGRENVRLNAALLGLTSVQIDQRFEKIIEFADIGEFIEQPVRTYSSGMMMRLAFAVQTAVEPELLIIDEALSVGDARFQKKCFSRLEDLRRGGATILLVTHDTGTVVQFCSRAIVLDGGRIVADGAPPLVARQYHQLLFGDSTARDKARSAVVHVGSVLSETDAASVPSTCSPSQLHDESIGAEVVQPSKSATDEPASSEGPDSLREVRYGSREAEIFKIGIRDAAGQDTCVVEAHGTYEFYYEVRFLADVNNSLGYGFLISNQRGIEIFATKAGLYGKALPPSSSGCVYECRFRAVVPIVPGTYFLTAAIAHDDDRRDGQFLDCRFDALQFQVVGSTRAFTTSIFDMKGELSHSLPNREIKNAAGGQPWALQ